MKATREISVEDVTFTVEFNYSPYVPATMYRANGDPGDPAEGGEVEILTITLSTTFPDGHIEYSPDLSPFLNDETLEYIQTELEESDLEPEEDREEGD